MCKPGETMTFSPCRRRSRMANLTVQCLLSSPISSSQLTDSPAAFPVRSSVYELQHWLHLVLTASIDYVSRIEKSLPFDYDFTSSLTSTNFSSYRPGHRQLPSDVAFEHPDKEEEHYSSKNIDPYFSTIIKITVRIGTNSNETCEKGRNWTNLLAKKVVSMLIVYKIERETCAW